MWWGYRSTRCPGAVRKPCHNKWSRDSGSAPAPFLGGRRFSVSGAGLAGNGRESATPAPRLWNSPGEASAIWSGTDVVERMGRCEVRDLTNEVFLGPMNDHPHYDCSLTPAEHEPIKRSGRGHRPGCAVAEGHTFGKAKVCSACALARDDAGKVRASTIRRRFGVTTEQYDEMLARQNGGCAICGKTNPNGHRLAIDHNHRSGKVRGLLCRNCNSAIGQLLDSPELIRKAADYVESQAD